MISKLCSKCKETKPVDLFYNNRSRSDGLSSWCKFCHDGQSKTWTANNRDKRSEYFKIWYEGNKDAKQAKTREWILKNKYGIDPEDYAALLYAQDGVCAICGDLGSRDNLDVDHCHVTGRVRGLLCSRCNLGIGQFADDSFLLRKAADYLDL